jgi:hypothetical protein
VYVYGELGAHWWLVERYLRVFRQSPEGEGSMLLNEQLYEW